MNDSDSERVHSRYSKGEIIEVIHGVATLMGARRKKAFFLSEIKRIDIQIAFLEEQIDNINEKHGNLDTTIAETEKTARGPADMLLNLRAARQTFQGEYIRIQEIEKKSRQVVKEKNMSLITSLTEEIERHEKEFIVAAEKQLQAAESRREASGQQKLLLHAKLADLSAEYRSVLFSAEGQMDKAHAQMLALEEQTQTLADTLDRRLPIEEQELVEELKALAEQRGQIDRQNIEMLKDLERLQATKIKVDKLDDPKNYMAQLQANLEEDKLSTEAKEDVLKAVTSIMREVDDMNKSLANAINAYHEDMNEFERALPTTTL